MRTEQPATISRSRGTDRNGFSPWDGFVPFDTSQAESDLGTRFREIVSVHSQSVALVDRDEAILTYHELLSQADVIAAAIGKRLEENPVAPRIAAIVAGAGIQAIVGVVGALLAGCAYFPIDPAWPDARIRKLLVESKAGILLVDSVAKNLIPRIPDDLCLSLFDIGNLVCCKSDLGAKGASSETPAVAPGDTAAIFATSGSTGEPKLVALSHRAILFDIGRQTNDLFLGPHDRLDLLFSIGFSASLAPIFGALLSGAQLHLFDLKENAASLPGWLADREISLTTMSVSTLRSVFLAPRRSFTGKALRLASVGSEPLLAQDVHMFQQLFPEHVVLQNAMAATETRTYAQFFVVRGEETSEVVPIGVPVTEKEVMLLDNGEAVQEGNAGEIIVRSKYLASGYINDLELTRRNFKFSEDGTILYRTGDLGRWAPDGSLMFLGRTDWQVKIRGHRVELLAVEAALRQCSGVVNCAVVAREDQPGELHLVAYIVGLVGGTGAVRKLRTFLASSLPDYMAPSFFVFLDALPLNDNGKLDRNRLPAPTREMRDDAGAAATTVEAELRRLWSAMLKIEGFSRDATFVELGGDSLTMLQTRLHMQASFARGLPAEGNSAFYLNATLAETAAAIELESRSGNSGSALTQYATGGKRGAVVIIPDVPGHFLKVEAVVPYVGSDWSVYGLDILKITRQHSTHTLAEIAHAARLQIQSAVGSDCPLVLIGNCLGAQVGFEIARETADSGGGWPLVCTIDTVTVVKLRLGQHGKWTRIWNMITNFPQWVVWNCAEPDYERLAQGVKRRFASSRRRVQLNEIMGIRSPSAHDSSTLPESVLETMRRNFEAVSSYVPGSYAGPIAVFRTWRRTLFADRDPTMGWGANSKGEIDVEWLSGLHHTCMEGKNLKKNMVAINARIEAFQPTRLSAPCGHACPLPTVPISLR